MVGKVYLVGGGPGALELYTLKAMTCIQETDCLIYDHLIDSRILKSVKPTCECIYVGKQAQHHTLSQSKINQLLVNKAQVYQHVVRLKGGDVYVFGRGGEEALTLYQNGIDFEVVPGLSSAIAGLCYGGIPITHRGLSSGFEVVTAHHQNQADEHWDYQRFLNDDLTYVFMMGKAKLEIIVQELLKVGKHPQTPMALIANATLDCQQTCYGQLDNILTKYHESPLPTPLLIVMGRVVSLHHELNFFARKSYYHKKVIVATVTSEPLSLTQYFQQNGATVQQVQVGQIEFLHPQITPEFKNSVIVMTSQNGIKGFFKWLADLHYDHRHLQQVRFACIGKKTDQVLNQYGFYSDLIAHSPNSEALNEDLKSFVKDHEHLFVVQEEQHCQIKRQCCEDQYIKVYHNQAIAQQLEGHYDLVCLTCASSVARLALQPCSFRVALSIGPMTTKAIQRYYPDVIIWEADEHSYQGMIQKMEENKDVL